MKSTNKKLSVALYWHMHQPVYQLSPNGDYLMPWVRLHAVKDYLDMLIIIGKFKKIKLNFNLVPVLLDCLTDYGEKGLHDIHSRLTVKPEQKLTADDKKFIINNFFDASYKSMILPLPEYNRLFQKAQQEYAKGIKVFTNREYADLTALFNLAWIDPVHREKYPEIKKLIAKGKNYTLKDRIRIIEIQREIIRKIIPAYKRYMEKGRIEITTSPYYHPILPILLDINGIKETVGEKLTDMLSDARLQTEYALNRMEELFGRRPRGIWPSEHCLSTKELELFADLNIDWTISDEGILADTINYEFVRDFRGNLEEPYKLLKSYNYKTKNADIKLIFRDSVIPNLINFEYPNHDSINAANDLYDRIKVIQSKLLSSPDENHLLTIAMDGENCWENYEGDGYTFLKELYTLIEKDDSLETVLISDYLDSEQHHKTLNKISSGSWINRNFKLWINEPLKDLAWQYVQKARNEINLYKKEHPSDPNISYAMRELFICEGSDWFWWFGEPNDSGHDNIFDYIFREHLKNIYLYLGLVPPQYLENALSVLNADTSDYSNYEYISVINTDAEQLYSGCIEIPDGPVLQETKLFDKICFGGDKENFYLRFYMNEYIRNNPSKYLKLYRIYVYMRNANKRHLLSPFRLINKTEKILPLTKEKFHNELQFSIKDNKIGPVRLIKAISDNLWVIQSSKEIITEYKKNIDIKIPFEIIDIKRKETLEFIFANAVYGVKDMFIPDEHFLHITRN